MKSFRDWVNRHRKALIIGAGAAGVGYILYRTVRAHYAAVISQKEEGEAHAALLREAEARVEAQLQSHFENIQRIADSTTLPSVWPLLKKRLFELVDLSGLTEKLRLGKEDPQAISAQEKMQLWQQLKIRSFTRAICFMWAVTMLHLFVRVQLNILGRHVYIDTARDLSTSVSQEHGRVLSRSCQHKYIAFADFLPQRGLDILIFDIEMAVEGVLISKPLKEPCTHMDLRGIFSNICEKFKGSQRDWLHYLLPDDNSLPDDLGTTSFAVDATQLPMGEVTLHHDDTNLKQLWMETRAVLLSNEFVEVLASSLEAVLDGVMEEFSGNFHGGSVSSVPMAKLLPPVASIGNLLLEHPSENMFVRIIGGLPQLQSFCAMVYSNAGEC